MKFKNSRSSLLGCNATYNFFIKKGAFGGRFFLKPGPINYGEEKMLQFFGQLLGISVRAGIPLPWDLMPTFWMSLCEQPLQDWNAAKVRL